MVKCSKCGMECKDGDKFCGGCGEIVGAADPSSKSQKEFKGFQTNYQRVKGITTDESMKEIEEFARTGVRPEATPGTVPWQPKTGSNSGASKFSRPANEQPQEEIKTAPASKFPKGKGAGDKLFEVYTASQPKYVPKKYEGKKWGK
mmetsp:Transcript_3065/g.4910  ORF Transcript_3065/g.4910 Transcript_3065/m.4910 type:complete len:146 (+) Transcript_3065:51-488(+)